MELFPFQARRQKFIAAGTAHLELLGGTPRSNRQCHDRLGSPSKAPINQQGPSKSVSPNVPGAPAAGSRLNRIPARREMPTHKDVSRHMKNVCRHAARNVLFASWASKSHVPESIIEYILRCQHPLVKPRAAQRFNCAACSCAVFNLHELQMYVMVL